MQKAKIIIFFYQLLSRPCDWPRRKEKSDKPAKMRYYSRTERQNAAKPMKMTAEMRTEGEKYAADSYSKSAE